MSDYNLHTPVMLREVLSFVKEEKQVYLDLTLGRAGHAEKILEKLKKGSSFYGIDKDQEAIEYSKCSLAKFENKILLHYLKSDFMNAPLILEKSGLKGADFILMDIGVSSPQFDDPSRGFSYRYDAKLDMRMDQSQGKTARDILNTADEKELIHIFRDLGQCHIYYPVVKKILATREEQPIETTFQLVDIIKSSLPSRELRKQGHPAKQFFLGLRYEVNGEIDELKIGLKRAIEFLNPKGRLVIISFNSEEDRIVKDIFRSYTKTDTGDKYHPVINASEPKYQVLTKKPLTPQQDEIEMNNRSKPSILRAIERR